jgi:uncharacterized protein with PQ loop repeat
VPFVTLLAGVCTALSLSFVWPQVVRVYRSGSVEGISPTGTLHGVSSTALWTMYGFAQGLVPLTVANLSVGVALVLIGVAQVRARALSGLGLTAVAAGCVAAGVALAAVSPTLLGWVAIVVGGTSIVPQVLHVVRADDLSGVSPATYGLLLATCAGWGLYGILIDDPLVAAPNALVLPCAAFILVRVVRAQRAASRTAPAPGSVAALADC